jgi:hypothetical protein
MAVNQVTKGKGSVGKLAIGGVLVTATATQLNQIAAATGTVNAERVVKVGTKAIGGTALHAGIVAWQNPEASAIIITRITYDVTTKSTGASTTDIGTTATNATTASDNLIDGLDSGTAIICADNINNAGSNGKSLQKLAAAKWVTFQEKTGDVTGLVATAYIHYTVV